MFFAVVFGYLLSTVMIFAGIFNVVQFVSAVNREDGYAAFLGGLADSCVYLVVAVVVILLIQIASFVEKLVSEAGRSEFVSLPSLSSPHATAKEVPLPVVTEKKKEETVQSVSYSENLDKKPMCVVPPDAPRVPELPIGENAVRVSSEEKQESGGLHYFKM